MNELTATQPLSMSAERVARARSLDRQVVALRDDLQERWYKFTTVLFPIYSERLFIELGYRNWSSYVEETLKVPVTTIGNYLQPYARLLGAGIDPSLVADVPLSRVSDLATLARANDGRLDPDLLEQAKTAHTREESRAFKERVAGEKERLGIEPFRTISLLVPESLYDLFKETTFLVAQLAREPMEKKHEILCLEMSMVALQDTPEIRELIERGETQNGNVL